jgi:hypothetical protein
MRRAKATIARKNLMVEGEKVRKLQHLVGASTESEAVRLAIDRALAAEEAIKALERLRKRGTWGKHIGR